MPTKTTPINQLKEIKLPPTEVLIVNISKKASTPFGQDTQRDIVVLNFANAIGGSVVNGRGLSLLWANSIVNCLPRAPEAITERIEGHFAEVVMAIAPQDIARDAIAFKEEDLIGEAILRARADPPIPQDLSSQLRIQSGRF